MKLMERVQEVMALKHYARRTRECYEQWITRYLKFHRGADGTWRHPDTMGEVEVEAFLTDLAVRGKVSASTQNQALAALLFLHQDVLGKALGNIDACRACRPVRSVETTMIYTHVMQRGVLGVRSPLDAGHVGAVTGAAA